MPSVNGKKPAVKWGEYSRYASGGFRPPTPDEVEAWRTRFASADRGCLILDSRSDLPLVVVDIDQEDEALLAWAMKTFGETPLLVRSGRGWHLYYRAPLGRKVKGRNGFIGPTSSFGQGFVSPIDVKSGGAYAIASGSWHDGRSRTYEANQPITEELLRSLPVFDVDRYEQLCDTTKSLRKIRATPAQLAAEGAQSLLKAASRRQQERRSSAARQGLPSPLVLTEAIPPSTVVRTAAGEGVELGTLIMRGVFGTKFHCPWHEGGSPSANLFAGDDGVRLHCHSSRCGGGRTAVVAEYAAPEPVAVVETAIDRALAKSAATSDPSASVPLVADGEDPGLRGPVARREKPVSGPVERRITYDLSRARLVIRGADAIEPEPNAVGRRDVRSTAIDEAVSAGARYVFVLAPTSAGKSKSIGRYHERMPGEPRICAPTLRRSLATAAASTWDLFDYQEADNRRLQFPEVCRISICADSLQRLNDHLFVDGAPLTYQTLILDESESLAPHIHSRTMKGERSLGVYTALRSLVQAHSETVIISDATMSDMSIAWVAHLAGLGVDELIAQSAFIIDDRPRAEISPMQVIRFEPGVGDDLIAARHLVAEGRPFRFFCESKCDAKAIHRELSEMDRMLGRERVFLLVDADPNDEKARFLTDPNEWIRGHRDHGEGIGAIIHTSAMESGLSLTEPLSPDGGDVVLARVGGRVLTWPRVVQAMSRSRGASVWAIDCPEEGMPGETDPAAIEQALREARHHTDMLLFRSVRDRTGTIRRHPVDPEHLKSYCHTTAHTAKTRAAIGRDLFRYLASEGYDCRAPFHVSADQDRDASIRSLLEARGLVKAEEIREIVAAGSGDLCPHTAQQVLESVNPDHDRWLQARHVQLHDFYGVEVTEDLVEWDDDGTGRGRVDAYVDALGALQGDLGYVARRDMNSDRYVTAGAKMRGFKAMVRADLMRTVGITPEVLTGAAEGETRKLKLGGEKREHRVHIAVMDEVWRCALAQWLAVPVVRRGVRTVCTVDPWQSLGEFGRRLIEAGEYVGGAGLVGPPRADQLRRHQIGTLFNHILRGVGIRTRSRRLRFDGVKQPCLLVLLDSAAKVRQLSEAHWKRVYGVPIAVADTPPRVVSLIASIQTPESIGLPDWAPPPNSLTRRPEIQS